MLDSENLVYSYNNLFYLKKSLNLMCLFVCFYTLYTNKYLEKIVPCRCLYLGLLVGLAVVQNAQAVVALDALKQKLSTMLL